jgi:hypothetical protein
VSSGLLRRENLKSYPESCLMAQDGKNNYRRLTDNIDLQCYVAFR